MGGRPTRRAALRHREVLVARAPLLQRLRAQGWAAIGGTWTDEHLVALASTLGAPIPGPNGRLLKRLRPTDKNSAPLGTLSARYGRGHFPLHTDTAFWPTPAKYVVLRNEGDTRRETLVCRFEDVLRGLHESARGALLRSVWRVPARCGGIYCSLRFVAGAARGWRWDAESMRPANAPALALHNLLPSTIESADRHAFKWSPGVALVLANWEVLHGRGPEPEGERDHDRSLVRVYVR